MNPALKGALIGAGLFTVAATVIGIAGAIASTAGALLAIGLIACSAFGAFIAII